jgi:hypothetical protein
VLLSAQIQLVVGQDACKIIYLVARFMQSNHEIAACNIIKKCNKTTTHVDVELELLESVDHLLSLKVKVPSCEHSCVNFAPSSHYDDNTLSPS